MAHVPKVLYWWRGHGGSTASGMQAKPYALAAGAAAVEAQLLRLGMPGRVEPIPGSPGAYRTRYDVTRPGRVTVLIPNKDHSRTWPAVWKACTGTPAGTIWRCWCWKTIPHRPKRSPVTGGQQQYPNCRVLTYKGGFNFSAINNFGARHATGAHLLLLNNDIQVETPGFVRELLSYSQRPDVGAVGAKLFYPDGTIQHAGVFIGLGGSAGHSHKGHPPGQRRRYVPPCDHAEYAAR